MTTFPSSVLKGETAASPDEDRLPTIEDLAAFDWTPELTAEDIMKHGRSNEDWHGFLMIYRLSLVMATKTKKEMVARLYNDDEFEETAHQFIENAEHVREELTMAAEFIDTAIARQMAVLATYLIEREEKEGAS